MLRSMVCRSIVFCFVVLPAGTGAAQELWLNVPFVRQSRNGCGSACIAMIMKYWDAHRDRGAAPVRDNEPAIYRKLHSPDVRGIRAGAMKYYLEDQGYRVFIFKGSWQDIRRHISKGRPLIVCLESGSSHYTVVAGIDSEQGIVLVNDPARRKLLKMKRAGFEKDWRASGNWTLLAVPQTPE